MDAKTGANYDRGIAPAEVAARQEREGKDFKKTPQSEDGNHTTDGYTTDREGMLNNYAIEPEMYVNEPGDLKEQEEAEVAQRRQELQEINREGGKGQGIV
ncbi:MAG: hypothetical protein HC890_14245 [Chloroflexaceae bacterium]|nr:hypothetical protein [Chloroflexaceae bacterium]